MFYKILVVDDEPNVVSGYRRTLERHFMVYVAASGFEGIDLLKSQGPFALVIADYCMPNMDGNSFLRQAKNITPDTLRIMLTGKADLEVAIEAVNQGNIYKFLTKPCHADFLLETVIAGVEEYRLKQAVKKNLSPINSGRLGKDYLPEAIEKPSETEGEKGISVSALGTFKFQYGNEVVPEKTWRNPKVKHLFFFLLTYRYKKIDREVLLETFWPEKAPDVAANNFSSLLYYLRKVVGHGTICYEKGLCWLNTEGIWCDAVAFEDRIGAGNKYLIAGDDRKATEFFQEAIALYRGDFLNEYLYNDWLERERQRLKFLYIETLINLAKLWAKTGRLDESILLLKKVTLNDFHAERVVSMLVGYLILSGRKAEAKATYHYYQELYKVELGLELSGFNEEIIELLDS